MMWVTLLSILLTYESIVGNMEKVQLYEEIFPKQVTKKTTKQSGVYYGQIHEFVHHAQICA